MARISVPLHQRLSHALAHDEFELFYQPLVELSSGRIGGAEALIRWKQNDGTYALPGTFIPQAEQTGFIIRLDQWVLQNATEQFSKWRKTFDPNLYVAVNLSASQFAHPLVVSMVRDTLRNSMLDPAGLELEITESAAMQDPDISTRTIGELRKLGVAFSLDDFGTGYSSLAYLHRFPFRALKIDRSFITDFIAKEHRTGAIVSAIIALGHALDLHIVAEGIETGAQLDFLRDAHCNYGQGWHFGKAVTATQFEQLLSDGADFSGKFAVAV